MKLGRKDNETIILVEVENGKEVNGVRTEEDLYLQGYKKACLGTPTSDKDIESWIEYDTCLVQEWITPN